MRAIKRLCRYLYYRFIRIEASPEYLARGMALGLFISTTPTMGIQTFIALFLATLLRCHKLIAVVAAQLTNAITGPPIYFCTYYLGAKIMGIEFQEGILNDLTFEKMMEMSGEVFLALWVGGVLSGIVLAGIGYYAVLKIDTKAHRRHVRAKIQTRRQERKNNRLMEKID